MVMVLLMVVVVAKMMAVSYLMALWP